MSIQLIKTARIVNQHAFQPLTDCGKKSIKSNKLTNNKIKKENSILLLSSNLP